ncbi:hypothetical protein DVH05_022595 [Phytophthora capsici]|nr:hypothetical protein DVH05_022595 [Phytophthora capsici]
MNLHSFLLFATILLAFNDAVTALRNVDDEIVVAVHPQDSTRHKATNKEERGFGKIFTQDYPNKVFQSLKLAGKTVTELDNPKVLEWLRYSKAYQKKHGTYSAQQVYYQLRDIMPEAALAKMLERLKGKSGGLKTLAAKVQISQFNRWKDDGMYPSDVARMLNIGESGATRLDDLVYNEFNVYWAASHL